MAKNNGKRGKLKTSGGASRVSKKPRLDYSVRYGNNYSNECSIAHKKLEKFGSICCCCLKHSYDELHHTSYGVNNLGINWYPVCERCHTTICHGNKNWVVCKSNKVWGNRNTEELTKRLRLGFKLIYGELK